MRIKRETEAVFELGRAGLDTAHHRVAIFYRKREHTTHEWRAHALEFALRHLPRKHQPLRPAAERAYHRAHARLPSRKRRHRLRTDFDLAGRHIPERLRLF